MPQMAPISWLILFLLFSFTMIMFSIMNYYTINSKNFSSFLKPNLESYSMKYSHFKWLW